MTLPPTFNVSIKIAQSKLQKKQAKRNFFYLVSKNSLHSHGVGTVGGGEMNCSENFLHSQFDSQVCRLFAQRCRLYVCRKMLATCLLLYYKVTLSASSSSPKINQIVKPN